MKEEEFLKKLKKLNLVYHKSLDEGESIELPIYFSLDENDNVVLDTDGIREEFEEKLNNIWGLTNEETDELTELVEDKIDLTKEEAEKIINSIYRKQTLNKKLNTKEQEFLDKK